MSQTPKNRKIQKSSQIKDPNNNKKKFINLEKDKKRNTSKEKTKKKVSHYQKYSDKIFKFDNDGYMKSFIVPGSDKYTAFCIYCDPDLKEPFLAQQAINHVFSKHHSERTPETERETKLKALLDQISQGKQEKQVKNFKWTNKNHEQKNEEESKEFLEFVGYCLAERLSFLQISKLGNFLKSMMNRDEGSQLKFFLSQSFNKEIVSTVASDCFGKYLSNQIYQDLSDHKYSISLDTSTVAGENICAIKARYATNKNQISNQIHDRIIAIKKLQEDCNAYTLMRIVEEKVFNGNEKAIAQNLIGVASDRGSALVGVENGLFSLIQKALPQKLIHVPDPCHSFNLVIRHSLEVLSPGIKNFISDIHNYFCSPQRRERLKQLQRENNLKVLCPRKYVKTRWLSLGSSLERLLEIWTSLTLYMNTMTGKKGLSISQSLGEKRNDDNEMTSVNYEHISNLLADKLFHYEITFLSLVIKIINIANQRFQTKSLEISSLKYYIQECYTSILSLIVKHDKLDFQNLRQYTTLNWMNEENHQIWFYENSRWMQHLIQSQPLLFDKLNLLTIEQQNDFCSLFKPFLAKILDLMIVYLPLTNDVIDTLDFVYSFSNYGELSEKILTFNSYFEIIGKAEIPELLSEIKTLSSRKSSFYTEGTQNILEIWSRIEKDESFGCKFQLLSKIFRAAQSLPITSSNIERAFSSIKLVKTLLRNQLSEDRLSSIYMIIEEFQEKGKLPIDKTMLDLYETVKESIRIKNLKRKHTNQELKKENEEEKNSDERIPFNNNSEQEEYSRVEEEFPIWDNCETFERKHHILKKAKIN